MNIRKLTSILLFTVLVAGCDHDTWNCIEGNHDVSTQSRELESFTAISTDANIEIIVAHGSSRGATVVCEANLHQYVETRVDRGTLHIGWLRSACYEPNETVVVKVTAPGISALQLSGTGGITADSLNAFTMNIHLSGSGNIDIAQLIAPHLAASTTGSGSIFLNGTGKNTNLRISGSGELNALNFTAKECSARISGTGDMYLNADSLLDATITGTGNIWYTGNPTVEALVTGTGEVKKF